MEAARGSTRRPRADRRSGRRLRCGAQARARRRRPTDPPVLRTEDVPRPGGLVSRHRRRSCPRDDRARDRRLREPRRWADGRRPDRGDRSEPDRISPAPGHAARVGAPDPGVLGALRRRLDAGEDPDRPAHARHRRDCIQGRGRTDHWRHRGVLRHPGEAGRQRGARAPPPSRRALAPRRADHRCITAGGRAEPASPEPGRVTR